MQTRSKRASGRVVVGLAVVLVCLVLAASRGTRPSALATSSDAVGADVTRAPQAAPRSPATAGPPAVALEPAPDPGPASRPWVAHLRDLRRSASESKVLWQAEQVLVAECMRSRGFAYTPVPSDDASAGDLRNERVDRGDAQAARALGYGIAHRMAGGEIPKSGADPNDGYVAALPPERRAAYQEALGGPPISPTDPRVRDQVVALPMPGGGTKYWFRDCCFAEARSQLYGDDYEDNELGAGANQLERELGAMIQRDPGYATALERWRGCMRERGHAANQASDIPRALVRAYRAGTLSLEQLREREVAAATTDADCYAQANLAQVEQEAFGRAEEALVAARQDRLAGLKAAQVEALARAESFLEESATPD